MTVKKMNAHVSMHIPRLRDVTERAISLSSAFTIFGIFYMHHTKHLKTALIMASLAVLSACGGGDSATPATPATPATAGVLTITESYNTVKGELNFAGATGTNSAEGPNAAFAFPYCAIRVSGVKVGTSTDNFDVNLYFKQSDKTAIFVGIINNTNFISFNMRVKDADFSKITLDTASKSATFNNVGLQSNENASNQAVINGKMAFVGSSTAACGS
jgi:hypothetical protein